MASRSSEEPKVEMTPMIDVVFQLLIFFVVTLKQEDILAKLMASRPAPDPNAKPDQQPDLIDITVHKHGFIFKQRAVSLEGLDRQIERYSRMSKNATVIIRPSSPIWDRCPQAPDHKPYDSLHRESHPRRRPA